MDQKPGVTVTYNPALIRIDGNGKLIFKMDEISEYLGREMTAETVRGELLDPLRPHGAHRRQHGDPVRRHERDAGIHLTSSAGAGCRPRAPIRQPPCSRRGNHNVRNP